MRKQFRTSALIAAISLDLILVSLAAAQQPEISSHREAIVFMHATGPFDVKVTPQDDKTGDTLLGRMMLDKQYHGDLEATGKGQMLTAGTDVKGSGAYVAIERVTAALRGRTGSFVLSHSGVMTQGVPHLTITIVPDSGTGQLAGITGKMTINIADGQHSYDLEYLIPPATQDSQNK